MLAAALEEFSANGFGDTRVADIANRAGVDKQLISYYFGGKAGLYAEVLRARLEHETLINDPDLPLGEIAARYLRHNLADPRMSRLLLWAGLSASPELTDALPQAAWTCQACANANAAANSPTTWIRPPHSSSSSAR